MESFKGLEVLIIHQRIEGPTNYTVDGISI